jgi:hypothetical protein
VELGTPVGDPDVGTTIPSFLSFPAQAPEFPRNAAKTRPKIKLNRSSCDDINHPLEEEVRKL